MKKTKKKEATAAAYTVHTQKSKGTAGGRRLVESMREVAAFMEIDYVAL